MDLARTLRWTLQDLREVPRFVRMGPALARAARGEIFPVLLARRAAEAPDRPFLRSEDRTMTYGEVARAADRCAHALRDAGVRRGEVVAIMMDNSPSMVVGQAAMARLGSVGALINSHLTGEPLAHVLRASRARHVVTDAAALPSLLDLRPAQTIWLAGPDAPDGVRSLDEAIDAAPDDPFPAPPSSGSDVFLHLYTSGTTGVPKAARVTYRAHALGGVTFRHLLGLGPDDVVYAPLPLYHGQSNIVGLGTALASGGSFASRRTFSAHGFLDDARRHGVTAFVYVGELCRYLMRQPPDTRDRDHRIRVAVGAGLRPDIWRAFQERFGIARILEIYGESEGNVALMNIDGVPGAAGRPMPFEWPKVRLVRYDVARGEPVRGPDGFLVQCAIGEPGLLLGKISGGMRADGGYVERSDMDERVIRDAFRRGDRWYRSSDLLRRDRNNDFFFVDRIGDTFRWKGENVSTQEVAEHLNGAPGVAETCVYGVEIPGEDGRAGMAAVVIQPGESFSGAAFFSHVSSLPAYARPAFVRIVVSMDVTATLKHRKGRLREEGYERAGDDPVFVRDDDARAYVDLDDEQRARLASGRLRL